MADDILTPDPTEPTTPETPEPDEPAEPDEPKEIEIKDSILLLTKKKIGAEREYKAFDEDIITAINTAIFELNQIGIGEDGFTVEDENTSWNDLLGDRKDLEAVKDFIYISVKLSFDPPSSSFVLSSLERQLEKLTFRLNIAAEAIIVKPEEKDIGGAEDGESGIDNQ